jgi:hypothetical protein
MRLDLMIAGLAAVAWSPPPVFSIKESAPLMGTAMFLLGVFILANKWNRFDFDPGLGLVLRSRKRSWPIQEGCLPEQAGENSRRTETIGLQDPTASGFCLSERLQNAGQSIEPHRHVHKKQQKHLVVRRKYRLIAQPAIAID